MADAIAAPPWRLRAEEGLPGKGRGQARDSELSATARSSRKQVAQGSGGPSSSLLFSRSVAGAPLLLSEMNSMPVKS